MFRTKVAIALFTVFTVGSSVLYLRLDEHVETMARARVERELRLALGALEVMRRLQDYAIVAKATEVATWPQIGEVLARPREAFADPQGNPPSDEAWRRALHDLVQKDLLAWTARFEQLADGRRKAEVSLADARRERPDVFFVVDAQGIGVANADERGWFGPAVADIRRDYPAIGPALDEGRTVQDIWLVRNAPTSVAAVPVRREGRTVGAVVVGYRLAENEARRDARLVAPFNVAYFLGDRLKQSSSLDPGTERELAEQFAAARAWQRVGGPPVGIEVSLKNHTHLGYVGTLERKASAQHAGFYVFGNLDRALADARSVLVVVPIAGGIGLLLSLGLVLLFYRRQTEPFEDIDQGILEIINGNLDYWFDVPGKELAGTMSQNLNIMVCQLSGRPMPDDDEATEGARWVEDRLFIDEIDPSEFPVRPVDGALAQQAQVGVPADAHSGMGYPPDVLRLVRETEETYRRRVFKEYTDALRARGESVAGMSFEKFTAKLETNANTLRARYNCRQVRFLVVVAQGKVTLKPVPMS